MAFQSSTSIASNQQLIDAVATFAAANGWTIDRNTFVSGLRTVSIHKAGVSDYVHLSNASTNNILLRASTGYDDSLSPGFQPGVTPADCVCNNLVGPYPNVWMFADGNEINVVVRRSDTTGAYSHFAFGVLTKYGAFTGGTFVDGTYFNSGAGVGNSGEWDNLDHALFGYGTNYVGYVRADADSATNKWFGIQDTSSNNLAITNVGPLDAAQSYFNPTIPTYELGRWTGAADANVFSGRSILHVITVNIRRQGSPAYFSPIGHVANTRYMSLAKFDPEAELTIASDTWMVFPVVRKGTQSGVPGAPNASGDFGFAIRKVV